MKKIITSILFLLVTLPILAQEKTLEKVDDNYYEYKVYDDGGELQQSGWYKNINGKWIPDGIWKDRNGTTAFYENGKVKWIKPLGKQKYTMVDIREQRLKRKLNKSTNKVSKL